MSAANRTGRRAIWAAHGVIDTAVLVAIILMMAIGSFALWDSGQVVKAAEAANYEIYDPHAVVPGHSFEELQAINPEVFAWLTVYGTHIDYPIEQGPNNMKYVSTNAEGAYSLSGGIFLDASENRDFSSFPSILYGHHMEKEAMFGEIGLFANKSYFDARRYGRLFYDGKDHGLEFFAFVQADAYDRSVFRINIQGLPERQAYLDALLAKALHTRDLQVVVQDQILLLSTCSDASTNGRDILVGRITDQLFDNPFLDESLRETRSSGVDTLASWWAQVPWLAKIFMISLLLLLIALVVWAVLKRKHRVNQAPHSAGEGKMPA